MRDDSEKVLFQPSLQEALVNSSGMGRDVKQVSGMWNSTHKSFSSLYRLVDEWCSGVESKYLKHLN